MMNKDKPLFWEIVLCKFFSLRSKRSCSKEELQNDFPANWPRESWGKSLSLTLLPQLSRGQIAEKFFKRLILH